VLSTSAVQEHAAAGTLVGTIGVSDPNPGDGATLTLTDDAGGRFALDGNRLVVKQGAALDYETARQHTVAIEVKDSGNLRVEKTFTISVANLLGGPTLTGASVQENAKAGTLVGALGVLDPTPGPGVTYTILGDSPFAVQGNQLVVKAGAVLDYESARSHTVQIRAADAAGLTSERSITVGVSDIAIEQIRGTAKRDVLKGGLGADAFVFNVRPTKSNADKIDGFVVKDDAIWLENAIYKGLGRKGSLDKPQVFKKDMFFLGTKAGDAEDRIIYDRKSGKLWYDEDGTGAKAQVLIAQMSKNLRLTEKDFFVI